MISPIIFGDPFSKYSQEERSQRVLTYWGKKRNKSYGQKVNYVKRKKVADKKLRIKGRFITKEQALQ